MRVFPFHHQRNTSGTKQRVGSLYYSVIAGSLQTVGTPSALCSCVGCYFLRVSSALCSSLADYRGNERKQMLNPQKQNVAGSCQPWTLSLKPQKRRCRPPPKPPSPACRAGARAGRRTARGAPAGFGWHDLAVHRTQQQHQTHGPAHVAHAGRRHLRVQQHCCHWGQTRKERLQRIRFGVVRNWTEMIKQKYKSVVQRFKNRDVKIDVDKNSLLLCFYRSYIEMWNEYKMLIVLVLCTHTHSFFYVWAIPSVSQILWNLFYMRISTQDRSSNFICSICCF